MAIQLVKRWGDRVFFYHNGVEVDFYLPDAEKLIQVSYSLQDEETLKRETEALIKRDVDLVGRRECFCLLLSKVSTVIKF